MISVPSSLFDRHDTVFFKLNPLELYKKLGRFGDWGGWRISISGASNIDTLTNVYILVRSKGGRVYTATIPLSVVTSSFGQPSSHKIYSFILQLQQQ